VDILILVFVDTDKKRARLAAHPPLPFLPAAISSSRRVTEMILLRSHPADATQIQRVAVPMPHNGIPLKRFFSAIAIVKKLTRKSSIIFAGQPHLNPLLQATMLRSHPADTTQIQHRAVRMPCNSVALKRFYAAIAPSQPS
jgi:hypothetical protein